MKTILITAGETSGDHHAASLISAVKAAAPDARFIAMGGREMAAAGAEVRFPIDEYAFMGFSEVARHLPKIRRLEKELGHLLAGGEIDLYIPVDYPGMNLRIASGARSLGVPVLYFISPQVWAWAGWRTKKIGRLVDLMAVILPFEEDYYHKHGIPVYFCGHPMLGEIAGPPAPKEAPAEGDPVDVLLFPGSRRQEVSRHLGPMLGAARIIRERMPSCRFKLGAAPMTGKLLDVPDDMMEYVSVTESGTEELGGASLVIASSGTVTLQTAMSGTPMVVVYRTSGMTYLLARSMVKIPWIAMPNVLAAESIVPELIQDEASAERIAGEACSILGDADRYRRMSAGLLGLRDSLHVDGGMEELARRALELAGAGKR